MGWKNGLAACLLALALASECGEVATNGDAGLCTEGVCDQGDDGDPCAPGGAGKGAPCKTNKKSGGAPDAGAPLFPAPTDVMVPPCLVCARAEACCKAEGFGDCGYAVACAEAKPAEQSLYTALCRAVLEARTDGKNLPDACVF